MEKRREYLYTGSELFSAVWGMVMEKDEGYEKFIDDAHPLLTQALYTDDFHFSADLDYWCDGGIQLMLTINIKCESFAKPVTYRFASIKTLEDSDEAFVKMGIIFGQFAACANEFVRKHRSIA